jgi:hypothetical protein
VTHHEGQQLWRGALGRDNEVALVLPIGIVHDYYGPSRRQLFDGSHDPPVPIGQPRLQSGSREAQAAHSVQA